jgi:hypothetical protein
MCVGRRQMGSGTTQQDCRGTLAQADTDEHEPPGRQHVMAVNTAA